MKTHTLLGFAAMCLFALPSAEAVTVWTGTIIGTCESRPGAGWSLTYQYCSETPTGEFNAVNGNLKLWSETGGSMERSTHIVWGYGLPFLRITESYAWMYGGWALTTVSLGGGWDFDRLWGGTYVVSTPTPAVPDSGSGIALSAATLLGLCLASHRRRRIAPAAPGRA